MPPSIGDTEEFYGDQVHDWQEICHLVSTNQIKLLRRNYEGQRVYRQWINDTLAKYGSIEDYLLTEKLKFPPADEGSDRPPVIVLPNDFPYSVEPGVEHILIWSQTPLKESYVVEILEERYGSSKWEWVYFVNPPETQSTAKWFHQSVEQTAPTFMSFFWSFGSTKKTEQSSGPSPGSSPAAPEQPFKNRNMAFRKGVQYNMKIVVRGDVMTGKSTLFQRLQGDEFDPAYTSTPQIQVANIPWRYKDTSDIIKIEIWDVVDKAHNKAVIKSADAGIKLDHNTQPTSKPTQETGRGTDEMSDLALDASTVDVYRNTHAVIFVFDITKQWTFSYVNKELEHVPENMAVLVLGNFFDKSSERVVTLEEIHATLYERNQERIEKGCIKPNLIRYAETSMKTGMGLKYIYDYLGVPFLQLQMETLKKQLELKAVEIVDTLESLDSDEKVPSIMRRRRGQDNFDQPSEPHLARQREEMQQAWDRELEEIAADHVPPIDLSTSPFARKATPPPPTVPARGRRREGSLISDPDLVPQAVDQFDAGQLEDDWFAEEEPGKDSFNLSLTAPSKADSDQEQSGNPMVAGDEDVESVEYYHEDRTAVASSKAAVHSSESEDEMSHQENANEIPVYKSELENVWRGDRGDDNPPAPTYGLRTARVESDSEDEDNAVSQSQGFYEQESQEFLARVETPPFLGSSFGGYEEIGGDSANPWSWDNQQEQDTNLWEDNANAPKDDEESSTHEGKNSREHKGKQKLDPQDPRKKKKSSDRSKKKKKKGKSLEQ